jgi:hypothetical protein
MSARHSKHVGSLSNKAALNAAKREPGRLPDASWLEKNIQSMYREVIDEPIPEELLKTLDRIQKLDA